MMPAAPNLDLTPRATEPVDAESAPAAAPAEELSIEAQMAKAFETPAPSSESTDGRPVSPAREFLNRIGLIERSAPIGELNREIKLEAPLLDSLYQAVEGDPETMKRFLKFANGAWFNSR